MTDIRHAAMMKAGLVCLGLVCLGLVCLGLAIGPGFEAFSANGDESAGPFEPLTLDAACKAAETTGKPVFVDFYATWCAPCRQMDKTTFADERVILLLRERTVAIKVDADKEGGLAARFRVDGLPTLMLIRPDGAELRRWVGFRDAAELLADLQAALPTDKRAAPIGPEPVKPTSDDPAAHMEFADALAARGQRGEALSEYLWCFDHGVGHDPAFAPLRRSGLPARIVRLGADYPPALEALTKRRDALENEVLAGRAKFEAILDYTAIVEALRESRRLLEVFDKLPPDSLARHVIFAAALDELLAARRYADVVAFEHPAAAVRRKIDDYRAVQQGLSALDPAVREAAMKSAIESIRQFGGRMVEALAGAGKKDEARDLIELLLTFDSSSEMRKVLQERATRAGDAELAASLMQP